MTSKQVDAYMRASKDLKQKFDDYKYKRFMSNTNVAEFYEPLLNPLKEISQNTAKKELKESQIILEKSNNLNNIFKLLQGPTDKRYGIRTVGDELYIGNTAVKVENDTLKFDNDKVYKITDGLLELLIKTNPKVYTQNDLDNYVKIVSDTSIHKQNYDPTTWRTNYSKTHKYNTIIRPIIDKLKLREFKANLTPLKKNLEDTEFSEYRTPEQIIPTSASTSSQEGEIEGFGLNKIANNNRVEYIYWNSLDELLERLYILYGELRAGNNNPVIVNEIVNIIQEFKEL